MPLWICHCTPLHLHPSSSAPKPTIWLSKTLWESMISCWYSHRSTFERSIDRFGIVSTYIFRNIVCQIWELLYFSYKFDDNNSALFFVTNINTLMFYFFLGVYFILSTTEYYVHRYVLHAHPNSSPAFTQDWAVVHMLHHYQVKAGALFNPNTDIRDSGLIFTWTEATFLRSCCHPHSSSCRC